MGTKISFSANILVVLCLKVFEEDGLTRRAFNLVCKGYNTRPQFLNLSSKLCT